MTDSESPAGGCNSHVHIMMPVYNDWKAVELLLARIDSCLRHESASPNISVLLVDDGSSSTSSIQFPAADYRHIRSVRVLHLRSNLGHQRAICVGICYLQQQGLHDPLIIMDADGEDAPEDIVRLLDQYHAENGQRVVFAARTKRSEGLVFRTGYWLYRILHRFLTGHRVQVGNFSILPPAAVSHLIAVPELWSHYAAAVYHSRIPWTSISTTRARRLDGSTHMNLVGLVVHGLSAISVFSDIVGVRLLLMCVLLGTAAIVGLVAVIAVRFLSEWAIPGWATFSAGLLLSILMQSVLLAAHFSFLTLSGRNRSAFLPSRDYHYFVRACVTVFPAPACASVEEL